jgi:hypothetical protein
MNWNRRIARHGAGALLIGLLLAPAPAGANAVVYHREGDAGPAPSGAVQIPKVPSHTLYIYVKPGSTVTTGGTPCMDASADGDELCALDVRIRTLNDVQFQSVVGSNGFAANQMSSTEIRINGLSRLSPIATDTKIAEAMVRTNLGQGGSFEVFGQQSVDAGFDAHDFPLSVIATTNVPEPGGLLLLLSGVLGLGALYRLHLRLARRA